MLSAANRLGCVKSGTNRGLRVCAKTIRTPSPTRLRNDCTSLMIKTVSVYS